MRSVGIAALIAVSVSGCASATRGWEETISISSSPSGATATVTGMKEPFSCTTPCVAQVKRSDDLTVAFDLPGHEPQIVPLTKEIATTGAAGFAGNLLLGGLVGMAVDGVSGAALDHKPNPVIVSLKPIAPPPAPMRPTNRARPVS